MTSKTAAQRRTNAPQHLAEIVERFGSRRILIIGDLIADQFLNGGISRISREAPVFILRHEQTETVAGGAANAAANAAALGGSAVLIGIVGTDIAGRALLEKLAAANVETEFVIESPKWATTTKVRVFAGQNHAPRQQVIRIDYENDAPLAASLAVQIIENVRRAIRETDAVIVSDYDYGAASGEIVKIAQDFNIPVFVDSRFQLNEFRNAASATPNEAEVEELLGEKFADALELENACFKLREKLNLQALLVTRGNQGMLLVERDKPPIRLSAIGSSEAVDVTGAGDTVMAAYALAVVSGASFAEAAEIANHAGGIVVMKRGTSTVSQNELLASLQNIK